MKPTVTRLTIDFIGDENEVKRFVNFCKQGRQLAYNWITDGSLRDTFGNSGDNLVSVRVDGEVIVEHKLPAEAEAVPF
jgi:hypothetical protein